MAKFEFKLPDIGEGVAEGEIVNWLVQAGDDIAENQEMVEVMTDKATVTIGAPKAGKVSELRFKVGDTVPVGQVLIVLDLGGAEAPAAPQQAATAPAPQPQPQPQPQQQQQQQEHPPAIIMRMRMMRTTFYSWNTSPTERRSGGTSMRWVSR